MGHARNASSGDKRSWWSLRQNTPPGAPVPGTGKRRYHKRKSGSNKSGSLYKLNMEWSATGRKQEDDQRGINNRARHQHIDEQVADLQPTDAEWAEAADAANCWDDA